MTRLWLILSASATQQLRMPPVKNGEITTPRETILAAFHTQLSALPATVLRGEVLPERMPAPGPATGPNPGRRARSICPSGAQPA